jgi:hypothetical protein
MKTDEEALKALGYPPFWKRVVLCISQPRKWRLALSYSKVLKDMFVNGPKHGTWDEISSREREAWDDLLGRGKGGR